jgi:thrombospondin type 3 repeat protein
MKKRFLIWVSWIAFLVVPPAHAALTTNVWTSFNGGKWESANWSAGVPALSQDVVGITNAFGGGVFSKAVIIDATTASTAPGSMTISNLFISGPVVHQGIQSQQGVNELIITNAGTFTVLSDLNLTTGSVMVVSNSTVFVEGGVVDDGYLELDKGATLHSTSPTHASIVGFSRTTQMAVTGGTWSVSFLIVGDNAGSAGLLEFSSGTINILNDGEIFLGQAGGAGSVLMSGGNWIGPSAEANLTGNSQLNISGGTFTMQSVSLDDNGSGGGAGTFTVSGGTCLLEVFYLDGSSSNPACVWLTGGQLLTTNNPSVATSLPASYIGTGEMTVSNGLWVANQVDVDEGTLTVAGGTVTMLGEFDVGHYLQSAGNVWVTGGQLAVTNGAGKIAVGLLGSGRMVVSGGGVVASSLCIASTNGPSAQLSMLGGSISVWSNLVVGNCSLDGSGFVEMDSGTIYVTNATHDATLEVDSGVFLMNGGTLVVDRLVITNSCSAIFDHTGGTLIATTILLNPGDDTDGDGLPNGWEQAHGLDPLSSTGNNGPDGDPDGDGFSNLQEYLAGSDPQNPLSTPVQVVAPPFQITSVVQVGNNIVLTWNTGGGLTNQVQVTSGGVDGSYSTNGFTNLSPQMIISGTGITTATYTDTDGATNKPSRYYRVRLVP